MLRSSFIAACVLLSIVSLQQAVENDAARRGEKALLSRSFSPPFWMKDAYANVWRHWDEKRTEPPADFEEAFRVRYGLHPAPYPNNGYPMGLRPVTFLLQSGVSSDCLLCHGGAIFGKSYVGLGNATSDLQALFEEMNLASGQPRKTPHVFSNVRGTNEAGAMSVYLLAYRDADLTFRRPPLDLDLHDNLCEDVPAWWLLKKKKTMYHTGGTSARSVRSLMQFMMHPLNTSEAIRREESTFQDILAFLLSLPSPKYPLSIDVGKAQHGQRIFKDNCSRCHGTYGEQWTYPNKIIALDDIGTDRTRFNGITMKFGNHYNQSWFAQGAPAHPAIPTNGYQAPPLDGIWATAPYFHNGSAPTVYDVLNSRQRPKIFTRSFRTDQGAYDEVKLGWKVQALQHPPDAKLPAIERRKIYDTTQPGHGNSGHTFGDDLSEVDRWAVIEYLKTL